MLGVAHYAPTLHARSGVAAGSSHFSGGPAYCSESSFEPWHELCGQIATGGLHCPDLAQRHQALFGLGTLFAVDADFMPEGRKLARSASASIELTMKRSQIGRGPNLRSAVHAFENDRESLFSLWFTKLGSLSGTAPTSQQKHFTSPGWISGTNNCVARCAARRVWPACLRRTSPR